MTTHEVVTSLFWIVAGSYLAYLGWFAVTALRSHRADRSSPPHT